MRLVPSDETHQQEEALSLLAIYEQSLETRDAKSQIAHDSKHDVCYANNPEQRRADEDGAHKTVLPPFPVHSESTSASTLEPDHLSQTDLPIPNIPALQSLSPNTGSEAKKNQGFPENLVAVSPLSGVNLGLGSLIIRATWEPDDIADICRRCRRKFSVCLQKRRPSIPMPADLGPIRFSVLPTQAPLSEMRTCILRKLFCTSGLPASQRDCAGTRS